MSAGSAVFSVLVRRDLRLFLTQRSRVIGALAQPLLFWVILGAGLAPSFSMPGAADGPDYFTWFFPGVVMMMLLFTSISSTMSVIEDRHQGFLQGVLAAPGPRSAVALGKTAGGAVVGLIHALLLLLLAPLAGFPFGEVNFLLRNARTATARAQRDTRCLVFERDAVEALDGIGRQALSNLMETLARVLALRLAHVDGQLASLGRRLAADYPDRVGALQA